MKKEPELGVLYLVGTPIGNLEDLSPRAYQLLKNVNRIACEDTRHSGRMLASLGIKARLLSFHQGNQSTRIPQLLGMISKGESIAIVSDAGLPGISDPGEDLVAAALVAGYQVVCIPGPCALTTALVSSGLPARRFCFEGFLPAKPSQRRIRLHQLMQENRTIVFYEAPHRLIDLLEDLQIIMGNRPLQVARELTKYHEELIGSTVIEVLTHFRTVKPQGECTIILGGSIKKELSYKAPWNQNTLTRMIIELDKGKTSENSRIIAKQTGLPRRQLYKLFHEYQCLYEEPLR